MGTGPFAVPSFDALAVAGHEITLVVTRPSPAIKSRRGPPPSPVRDWATEKNFTLFDPPSINDAEAIERVASLDPDLLVVCDYGQILKPNALGTSKLGGINLHGSLLPRYRGAAPVQWALLNGDSITGVSVIHMTPRLDGGPILCSHRTPIHEQETAGELEDRLSRIGVDTTLEAVSQLISWDGTSSIGEIQDASQATKAPRLKKADGLIDWARPAKELDWHVRGMIPWPVAYTFFQPKNDKPPIRIAVKSIERTGQSAAGYQAGEILPDQGHRVATGDELVQIQRVQPAGKKEMEASEFFRGHQPADGSLLFSG